MPKKKQIELTALEKKAVEMIPNSDDGRITGAQLAQLLQTDLRTAQLVIASLRMKGIPVIGDRREQTQGYYIPVSNHARKDGLKTLHSQLIKMNRVYKCIVNADLSTWRNEVEV